MTGKRYEADGSTVELHACGCKLSFSPLAQADRRIERAMIRFSKRKQSGSVDTKQHGHAASFLKPVYVQVDQYNLVTERSFEGDKALVMRPPFPERQRGLCHAETSACKSGSAVLRRGVTMSTPFASHGTVPPRNNAGESPDLSPSSWNPRPIQAPANHNPSCP